MSDRCINCKYATCDYEDYYGGGREYFVDGCKKCKDTDTEDCEDYEEREMDYDG